LWLQASDAGNENQHSRQKLRVKKQIVEFIMVWINNLKFDEHKNEPF
jgi:hypothetical protein